MNLDIFNKVKEVPERAKSEIKGGRMNGKTNICPMWRIEVLTETFGMVGFGWKTKTIRKWIETGYNEEKIAFLDLELYIKIDNKWSEAIEGTGSKKLVEPNKNSYYTNDEAFKMAYTDALGVACKAIGIGANVYFGKDDNKYTPPPPPPPDQPHQKGIDEVILKRVKKMLYEISGKDKNKSLNLLETFTTFTNRNNKIVKGVKTFEELSKTRLLILNRNIKKKYPSVYEKAKEGEKV